MRSRKKALISDSRWLLLVPSTMQGFGSITGNYLMYRKVGDVFECQGQFTTGTVTGDQARFGLLPGLTIADNYAGAVIVGFSHRNAIGDEHFTMIAGPGLSYLTFGTREYATTVNPFSPQTADQLVGSSQVVSVQFSVRVQEWLL